MAVNFRKRVRILPGVTLNIGKNGVSTTVGPKGASVGFGKNGTYLNTGIPGTGVYSRQKIAGRSRTGGQSNQGSSRLNYENTESSKSSNTIFIFFGITGVLLVLFAVTGSLSGSTTLLTLTIAAVLSIFIYAIKSNSEEETSEAIIEVPAWSEENFGRIQDCVAKLVRFMKTAAGSSKIRKEADRIMQLEQNDGTPWKVDTKLNVCMIADITRIYDNMGYKIKRGEKSNLGILLFICGLLNDDFELQHERLDEFYATVAPDLYNTMTLPQTVSKSCTISNEQYIFQHIFENVDLERMTKYLTLLHEFASILADEDGTISDDARAWLGRLEEARYLTTDGKTFDED